LRGASVFVFFFIDGLLEFRFEVVKEEEEEEESSLHFAINQRMKDDSFVVSGDTDV
jgi:hypothetical protein